MSKAYDLFEDKPLPPHGDWRLPPFKFADGGSVGDIEIVKLLSLPPDPSDSGGDAHVFLAHIVGRGNYAIKVFKFCSVRTLRDNEFPTQNMDVDDATLLFQSDPFFAECRAYGRIQTIERDLAKASKSKLSPRIVIPCFGFVALPFQKYLKIFQNLHVNDWELYEPIENSTTKKHGPFRALVKELVEGRKAVLNPPKILRDLKIMRASGVFPMDVHARNYLGGHLVDLSRAWTQPHWTSSALDSDMLHVQQTTELYEFNRMVKSECPKAKTRAIRDNMAVKKLRSSGPLKKKKRSRQTQVNGN